MKQVVGNKGALLNTQYDKGNVKKQKLWSFINKTNEKRTVSFMGLVAKFKQAIRNRENHFIYFANTKLVTFLTLLQEQGLIHNFYCMPEAALSQDSSLQIGPAFNARLLVVHLKINGQFGPALRNIHVFSVPSRTVTVTYRQLLLKSNAAGPSTIYVLNTPKGLLTHTVALQHRVGGELICKIN